MKRIGRGSFLTLLVVVGALGVSASAASASTVTVQATGTGGNYYNDSHIFIPSGKSVTVSGASGSWAICPPSCSMVGPGGDPSFPPQSNFASTTSNGATLLGSTNGGSSWTAIGTGSVVFNGPGELLLATNDIVPSSGTLCSGSTTQGCYSDNLGSVDVNVNFNHVPTRTGECSNDGWRQLNDANGVSFTSQGNCIQYVRNHQVLVINVKRTG